MHEHSQIASEESTVFARCRQFAIPAWPRPTVRLQHAVVGLLLLIVNFTRSLFATEQNHFPDHPAVIVTSVADGLGEPNSDTVHRQSELSVMRFPRQPADVMVTQSHRVVELINGDRITAELLAVDPQALVLRLFGQVRWRLPLNCVARITQRPGERTLPCVISDDTATIPPVPGWMICRFQLERQAAGTSQPPGWTALFADGSRLQIGRDVSGRWQVEHNPPHLGGSIQHVRLDAENPFAFRLQSMAGRLYISINGQLFFAGTHPSGPLTAIETTSAHDASSSWKVSRLMGVAEHSQIPDFPPPVQELDAIVSTAGEMWWGQLQRSGPDGVTWTAEQREWQRSWRDVSGVVLRTTSTGGAGHSLTGRIVRLELQPDIDRPDLPGDVLTVALRGMHGNWLEVEHSLAGRMVIPQRMVRVVHSLHIGVSRSLTAGDSALGEQRELVPSTLEGTFTLDELPTVDAELTVEASGLEPSGPRTPPGNRLLRALRSGAGVTEVFINDHRLGTLNELTDRWTLPGEYERLRVTVPINHLRRGENRWRIQQQPGDGSQRAFDECRLRAISLDLPAGGTVSR